FQTEDRRPAGGVRGRVLRIRQDQHARVNLAPVHRFAQLDLDALADEAAALGLGAQGPVDPGRPDLEPLVIDILDLVDARQLARHLFAIPDADASGAVYGHAQQAERGALDVDEFDVHASQRLLGQCEYICHMLKKNGLQAQPTVSRTRGTYTRRPLHVILCRLPVRFAPG